MTTFFVSDTHFGHQKVIEYCNRPFATVEQMDAMLIAAWNNTVGPTDTVYHLGDVMWHGNKATANALLDKLNGRKHLVVGNHDHKHVRRSQSWIEVAPLMEIVVDEVHVTLCHYPIAHWAGQRRGGVHFHGHMHGNPTSVLGAALDVGVDLPWNTGFRPHTLAELLPLVPGYREQPTEPSRLP